MKLYVLLERQNEPYIAGVFRSEEDLEAHKKVMFEEQKGIDPEVDPERFKYWEEELNYFETFCEDLADV